MRCPSCKGKDLGNIKFSSFASGAEFHYCRFCEHRWWTSGASTLDLRAVLGTHSALPRAS